MRLEARKKFFTEDLQRLLAENPRPSVDYTQKLSQLTERWRLGNRADIVNGVLAGLGWECHDGFLTKLSEMSLEVHLKPPTVIKTDKIPTAVKKAKPKPDSDGNQFGIEHHGNYG